MPVAEKHHRGRIGPRLARSALFAPALLLAITILFFWKLVLTNQYTWLDSPDLANQVLPWYQMQAREWHAGRFPLWDPYHWGGQPLLAQAIPGAAYPFNWILFLLPFRDGVIREEFLNWYFVLIHYLGALFCYWLCRDLKLSRPASVVAGAAFGLSGYIGFTDWPQMLNGAVWLPLILMFLLRAVRGERPIAATCYSGAALGMSLLSGHHQVPIFSGITITGLWIYFILRKPRHVLPLAPLWGIVALLTAGLQLLPAWEYGHLAVRWVGASHALTWKEAVPYSVHSQYTLEPSSLLGLVIPGLFPGVVFLGVVIVGLGVAGFFQAARLEAARLAGAVALAGALLAVGSYSVFHGVLYSLVPWVEKARNPSAAILICHFGLIILSAYGIDYLSDASARGLSRVAWIFGSLLATALLVLKLARFSAEPRVGVAALAAFGLAAALELWRRQIAGSRVFSALVLGALLFEAGNVSTWSLQSREKPDSLVREYAKAAPVADFLRKQPQPVRVEIQEQAVPYNFGDYYGIDAFDGYVASMPVNIEKVQGDYLSRMRFGANYSLGNKPQREGQKLVMETDTGLKLYANPEAYPPAWVERPAPCPAPDRVSRLSRNQTGVSVAAELGCPGTVVLGETFFPGWRTTMDGRGVPIREIHGALRAVDVPAGAHRIEMRYRPLSFYLGAACTASGWLICAALWLAGRRRPTG